MKINRLWIYFILLTGLSYNFFGQDMRAPKEKRVSPTKSTLDLERSFITLQRTRCLGTCSAYKVKILADGTLFYEGTVNVKIKEKTSAKLTKAQLKRLVAEFKKARYFTLHSSYVKEKDGCDLLSDAPLVYTSIQYEGRKKSVKHDLGCYSATGNKRFTAELTRLTDLENAVDEIININQWIGTIDERKQFQYIK